MAWNPKIEKMPIKELKDMQFKLLKMQVYRLYSFNRFYHDRMRQQGVHPDDIQTLDDVRKLPFMLKQDLRDNYPTGMFTASGDEVVRYHVSSGTTGKPTLVGYTERDLEMWTESLARALTSCGIGRGDVMQVSYGYGLFTGGLGLHYGAERVGATVLPTSTGNTERQIELMMDLGVTAIACTPSYMVYLGEVAERMGVSLKDDTELKVGIMGAEPWSEGTRTHFRDVLGVEAYDIYGTSELSGPLFTECEAQDGIHVWGDMALVEIIDPDTGEACADGEKSELVVTMLQKEALPMMRYRIGDITCLMEDECSCGRTHPRIGRISGRVDDMLIIRGINVFPSQVEHTLMQLPQCTGHFQIIVDRVGALDSMKVKVELTPEVFSDRINDLMAIRKSISNELKKYLNIAADVEFMEPGSLPRYQGKARRVEDRREM